MGDAKPKDLSRNFKSLYLFYFEIKLSFFYFQLKYIKIKKSKNVQKDKIPF